MTGDLKIFAAIFGLAVVFFGYMLFSSKSRRIENVGGKGLGNTELCAETILESANRLIDYSRKGDMEAVRSIVRETVPKGFLPPYIANFLAVGLFEAAAEGHFEIVRLLADHGANMDRPHASDGSTAMGIAAFAGRDDVVQFLTRRAANVNAKNSGGVTPFMLAAAKCSAETVSRMIDAKADLHSESDDGLTVKDFASMPLRMDILALLDSAPESGVNADGKELGLTAPAAKGGVCEATYEKHGFVMNAFSDIQSLGPIKYLYILEVSSKNTSTPQFYVTAEYNELVDDQELVLGLFDDAGHQNLGQHSRIDELHMFIATARLIALKHIAGKLDSL